MEGCIGAVRAAHWRSCELRRRSRDSRSIAGLAGIRALLLPCAAAAADQDGHSSHNVTVLLLLLLPAPLPLFALAGGWACSRQPHLCSLLLHHLLVGKEHPRRHRRTGTLAFWHVTAPPSSVSGSLLLPGGIMARTRHFPISGSAADSRCSTLMCRLLSFLSAGGRR